MRVKEREGVGKGRKMADERDMDLLIEKERSLIIQWCFVIQNTID